MIQVESCIYRTLATKYHRQPVIKYFQGQFCNVQKVRLTQAEKQAFSLKKNGVKMDNDLERSVRLLDNALSTPNRGLFRLNRSTAGNFNLSITMDPNEINMFLAGKSKYNQTMDTFMKDTTLTGAIVQTNSPFKSTLDSLFMEFFEVLQSHSGAHDVLDLITDLARCCSDALKVIQGLKAKVAVANELPEEKLLENERNTWRLLYILYQDRFLRDNLMEEESSQYFGRSEKLCVQNLYKRDCLVRESQLVIDWLESNSSDRQDQDYQFNDATSGWENTLHQLQSAETIAFASSRKVCGSLDPDGPHHEGKPLHDLDLEDEKRLSLRVFQEIRCGRLGEAQKLCRQNGQSWKAALLEGWRLFHNPNEKEELMDDGFEEQQEFLDLEGNRNRDIWKNMALLFCKQNSLSIYERAAVAVFCGDLATLSSACHSWEDHLWGYMKTMVDIRVESEIRDCCVRFDHYQPLPQEYWEQKMSLNEVFSNLDASPKSQVRQEAQQNEHVIQKYVILDEIPRLLQEIEDWLQDPLLSSHSLRFLAHLVLFFDQTGQGHNRNVVEKVLESYIKKLMELNETQLVAFYVSKLNENSQVLLYAKYLETILDNEERKQALLYAQECDLDVFAITKQIVENIRSLPVELEPSGDLQHKITEQDKLKISSLDWVIFYDNQKLEAIIQTNSVIFVFLTLEKLDAAQLAFNKIPNNYLEELSSQANSNEDINKILKEFLSYRAFLDAHEAFNEWFQQLKTRPVAPASLSDNVPFPEKVAHQHRMSQFKAETERWKLTIGHLLKTCKSLLYNVLLFPEGWLSSAPKGEVLREVCIPKIAFLLYTVLSESGLHSESIQLANILAAKKYGLYQTFSKEKLGELLVKLSESSVALLDQQMDPWGFEPSVRTTK